MATKNDLMKAKLEEIIAAREKADGHIYSGTGNGLSMFVTVYYKAGKVTRKVTSYGNGVEQDKLADDCRANIPGYIGLETRLD